MTLHVQTTRLGYRGSDWLDVSLQGNMRRADAGEVGGHRGIGLWFAPSPGLLYPFISKRKHKVITPEDWTRYVDAYTAEMRTSYRLVTAAWNELLALSHVVLLCFCTDPQHCHRRTLAGILVKLGAVDDGEITK